ncbi:hypothetical protein L0P88_08480 [Muricauda sp. SCSIO 64092]|uniref:hypothetical protein n=1 Tax=Allomuricauda sp. SCSIO 64092 TaxID=2908842 RepID=UPI001FF55073|nr:hypothetical protein [Muricauda sp. SCSIO 64092]UOY08576.1 hypothetical protein L0P88_08480 [Muricauda sp. SCSIO 64092]
MKKSILLILVLVAYACDVEESEAVETAEIIAVDYLKSEQSFTFDEGLELVKIEMECLYPCAQQFDKKTKFQFDDVQYVDFTPEIIGNTVIFKKEYNIPEEYHNYWDKSKKFKLTFEKKF